MELKRKQTAWLAVGALVLAVGMFLTTSVMATSDKDIKPAEPDRHIVKGESGKPKMNLKSETIIETNDSKSKTKSDIPMEQDKSLLKHDPTDKPVKSDSLQ
jgi:hypothetical protein